MTVLSARFAAEPASVPGARHFVTDGLRSWGLSHLIDDIALCVTELGANAALHSAAAFMSVTMTTKSEAVTISVEDDGEVVGAAVVPRADYSPDAEQPTHTLADEPTTGRGLAIVAALASQWGVHATDSGKKVWARFGGEPGTIDGDPADAEQNGGVPPAMPEGWTTVRLAECPVRLSLRQDDHLDELVRELQLIQVDDDTRSRSIAQQIHGLLVAPAHARLTGRRIAQLADEAGLEYVDIDMALPAEASLMIRQLHEAVLAADELCEDLQLLTLTSPPEMRALRSWMTEEIVAQIEEGRSPVGWKAWQAAR